MIALIHAVVLAADSSFGGVQILVSMLIGGAVGAAIGNARGRMPLGLVLGALLGCIGWIIIAVIPKKTN
ncbi:MAG: hypothetical protein JWO77_257 [Ilumatobacteraceae bacterium]|nr:hypothetical protein [Ilumatobacteraceae bacterium]